MYGRRGKSSENLRELEFRVLHQVLDEIEVLMVTFQISGSFDDERHVLQPFVVKNIVEKVLADQSLTEVRMLVCA